MMTPPSARRWFTRVVWVGIAANLALALPLLAAPALVLEAAALPTAMIDLWPRLAALLLVLLSVFYMPAAADPDRYRAIAWFTVCSRLAGGLFFLVEGYGMLALYDLVFCVLQAALLTMAVRGGAGAAAPKAEHL